MVEQSVRSRMAEMEEEPEEGWENWRENVTEKMLGRIVLETPWGIQQDNGIYGWNQWYGALVIEPLGYFASEPLSEDQIDTYNEDREKYFEEQMKGEESKEDDTGLILISIIIVLLVVILLMGKRR